METRESGVEAMLSEGSGADCVPWGMLILFFALSFALWGRPSANTKGRRRSLIEPWTWIRPGHKRSLCEPAIINLRKGVHCRVGHLLAVGAVATVLSACGELPQTTQTPVGDNARQLQELFMPILWIAVAIFVLVEGILLFSLIKFRRRPGDDRIPQQIHGNQKLEAGWTIAPALVVVVLAVLTFRTIAAQAEPPPADALKVNVTGHQWWWEFEYPELGIVTANELRVPVNRTVALTIKSADVIHSFWFPQLAGKIDAIPGDRKPNELKFTVPKPGRYWGQCSEFCGFAHAQMRMVLIAESAEEFESWGAMMKVTPNPQGEALRGAELFNTGLFKDAKGTPQGCFFCHSIQGTPAQGKVGPNLTGLGARTTIGGALRENTQANVAAWIRDPRELKPGVLMPALELNGDEISAVVAYLQSLK